MPRKITFLAIMLGLALRYAAPPEVVEHRLIAVATAQHALAK